MLRIGFHISIFGSVDKAKNERLWYWNGDEDGFDGVVDRSTRKSIVSHVVLVYLIENNLIDFGLTNNQKYILTQLNNGHTGTKEGYDSFIVNTSDYSKKSVDWADVMVLYREHLITDPYRKTFCLTVWGKMIASNLD